MVPRARVGGVILVNLQETKKIEAKEKAAAEERAKKRQKGTKSLRMFEMEFKKVAGKAGTE
jgi:hypothetical protein